MLGTCGGRQLPKTTQATKGMGLTASLLPFQRITVSPRDMPDTVREYGGHERGDGPLWAIR